MFDGRNESIFLKLVSTVKADPTTLKHWCNFAIVERLKKSSIKGDAIKLLRAIAMKIALLEIAIEYSTFSNRKSVLIVDYLEHEEERNLSREKWLVK